MVSTVTDFYIVPFAVSVSDLVSLCLCFTEGACCHPLIRLVLINKNKKFKKNSAVI